MSLISRSTERIPFPLPGKPSRIMRIKLLGLTIWTKEQRGHGLVYRLLGLPVFESDRAPMHEWY